MVLPPFGQWTWVRHGTIKHCSVQVLCLHRHLNRQDVREVTSCQENTEIATPLSSPVSSRQFTKVQTVRMHEAIFLRNITTTTFVVIPSTSAIAHSSWSAHWQEAHLNRPWARQSLRNTMSHDSFSKSSPSGSSRTHTR